MSAPSTCEKTTRALAPPRKPTKQQLRRQGRLRCYAANTPASVFALTCVFAFAWTCNTTHTFFQYGDAPAGPPTPNTLRHALLARQSSRPTGLRSSRNNTLRHCESKGVITLRSRPTRDRHTARTRHLFQPQITASTPSRHRGTDSSTSYIHLMERTHTAPRLDVRLDAAAVVPQSWASLAATNRYPHIICLQYSQNPLRLRTTKTGSKPKELIPG